MSQNELYEAIARSTGEDVRLVQELGFTIADPMEVNFDPEPDDFAPQFVDWDSAPDVAEAVR